MSKIKQRFYVDLEYDTKAISKNAMHQCIKAAVQQELADLARDFNTSIKPSTVTVGSEPLTVRAQRQAMKNADARNKRWTSTL